MHFSPAEAAASWSHLPFEGRLAGGSVWGRGALDDKESLVTLLEAVETLLAEGLAPATTFGTRIVLANRWLLGPLVERSPSAAPVIDAMLRTTLAPTIIAGGVKENVLPPRARAVVNLRIVPGDSVARLEEELRRRIGDGRVRLIENAAG